MGKSSTKMPEVNLTDLLPHQIPSVAYTIQNMWISLSAMVLAMASFFFTLWVVLPLSMTRPFFPKPKPSLPETETKKVVLIIGASQGIGFSILKQYADEPDTVIVAASRSIDSVRSMAIELGDTVAMLKCAEVDLSGTRKQISEVIKSLDKLYGPISHLYEVSGISSHVKDHGVWGLDITGEMISVNVAGTVASVLSMYDLMKGRGYGKICVVGSIAGLYSPANMISYASTKAFVNNFCTSLRILAAPTGVDVITVQPGLIDTRMTKHMRNQGSTVPGIEFGDPEGLAEQMKAAVEEGGMGIVNWPVRQGVIAYGLQAMNPICQELGGWVLMKMNVAGKRIT
ncbi:hypothetical protein NLJ89_g762 [Agrocybe chaxingu]|uniref:NAD(P)-binding protein n=1 Tax=Agrocybe chaxingu TaxID=84603 RepID=A0A9W8TEE7_9AGAR|nr:hypothetical protein NLJ89_g762 [Agrocybe chaxingu]